MKRRTTPVRGDDLHTVSEVAAYLKFCPTTVYRLVADGSIAALRMGGRLRITRQAVLDYLGRDKAKPVRTGPKGRPLMAPDPAKVVDFSVWHKSNEAMRRRKGLEQRTAQDA